MSVGAGHERRLHYFFLLPKSAGISPHCFVSHLMMGTVVGWVASQRSARATRLVGLGCRVIALEFGLAVPLLYPKNGVVRIGIDDLVANALLFHQGQGVDNGEELTDVVGATHRSKWKTRAPVARSMH